MTRDPASFHSRNGIKDELRDEEDRYKKPRQMKGLRHILFMSSISLVLLSSELSLSLVLWLPSSPQSCIPSSGWWVHITSEIVGENARLSFVLIPRWRIECGNHLLLLLQQKHRHSVPKRVQFASFIRIRESNSTASSTFRSRVTTRARNNERFN